MNVITPENAPILFLVTLVFVIGIVQIISMFKSDSAAGFPGYTSPPPPPPKRRTTRPLLWTQREAGIIASKTKMTFNEVISEVREMVIEDNISQSQAIEFIKKREGIEE